jgi:hypothetical protein
MAIGKITSKSLDSNAVTSTNLAPGAVTIADIADGEITAGKLHTTLDLSTKTLTLTQASVTAHQGALSVTQSQISDLSTTNDLTEGSTNLFFTDARADARVALLVDSAPGTLDTLNELAAALGDDANFSTTVTNSIATKLPLAGGTLTGGLTVQSGAVIINNSGGNSQIYLGGTGGSNMMYLSRWGNDALLWNADSGVMRFGTNNSEAMRIDSSGNIGIGTSPTTDARLEISGGGIDVEDGGGSPRLRFFNSTTFQSGIEAVQTTGAMVSGAVAGDLGIRSQSNMLFATGGNTERLRIDSNGKIFMNEGVPFSWTDSSLNVSAEIYGDASDNLVFRNTSAKTERMRIDAAGNVGIGITNPATKLHVGGIVQVVENSNTAFYGGNFVRVFGDQNYAFRDTGGSYIANISMSGNSYFNGGNVGIGTASPSEKLEVLGTIKAGDVGGTNGDIYLQGKYSNGALVTIGSERSSGGVFLGYGVSPSTTTQGEFLSASSITMTHGAYVASNTHKWWTASSGSSVAVGSQVTTMTERMRISADGNVGIGTSSPARPLNVVNDAGSNPIQSIRNSSTAWSQYALTRYGTEGEDVRYMDFGYYRGSAETNRGLVIKSQANATLVTFLDSGNVGIGTGTTAPGAKLKVDGPSGIVQLAGGSTGSSVIYGNAVSNHTGELIQLIDKNGAQQLVMTNAGNLGIGTSSPTYKLHVNAGSTNIAADFESTDGTAGIRLRDNTGNVELSTAGGNFQVQPGGSAAAFTVSSDGMLSQKYYAIDHKYNNTAFVRIRGGKRTGTGVYSLFQNNSPSTQSSGLVHIQAIYGTPSGAGAWLYKIQGNRQVHQIWSQTSGYSGSAPSLYWSGDTLYTNNTNSSVYYSVIIELHDIGNSWNPVWGNLPGLI